MILTSLIDTLFVKMSQKYKKSVSINIEVDCSIKHIIIQVVSGLIISK